VAETDNANGFTENLNTLESRALPFGVSQSLVRGRDLAGGGQ